MVDLALLFSCVFLLGALFGAVLQRKLQAWTRRKLNRPLSTDLEGLPRHHICYMWARRLIDTDV